MRNPRHSPAPSFATDVSAVGHRLHALLMRARRIKCFCEGAKTMLFKGKRAPARVVQGAQRTSAAMRLQPRARALQPTHPLNSPAHSAPKILLSVGRACPRPPQAGYARNAGLAPKTKSLRQNSRPARTIPIKSRPAACTSGGINNLPLKRKGRPMGGLFV